MGCSFCGNSSNYSPVISALFCVYVMCIYVVLKKSTCTDKNYVHRTLCKKGRLSCNPAMFIYFILLYFLKLGYLFIVEL